MASKKLMVVAAINLIWLAAPVPAQEKVDKAKMAKFAAEKFAKEFIQDKNVVAAMKLTSAPFLEIEQGREQKPKKIEKSADVEKQLREVVKRHDEIGIRAKVTISKVREASADVLDKSTKEVFDSKTDRIFVIQFTQDGGFPFELLALVGWRDDQPKVIGYGLYFSR
jgi:hypothetical protein